MTCVSWAWCVTGLVADSRLLNRECIGWGVFFRGNRIKTASHFNAQRPTPNAQRPRSEIEREALLALEVGRWMLGVEPAAGVVFLTQSPFPETTHYFDAIAPLVFPFHTATFQSTVSVYMKLILRIAPLLAAAAFARADIVIEQKMESAVINGNVTMKVKGDQARMDMPSPLGGNVTTLMNFKSGEMVTFMHQEKLAMKMNLSDIKKQQEAGQQALGVDPSKIEKPKGTGAKEKVGDFETEIFEMNQGQLQAKLWIAKDFPNAQSIKDQMAKLSSSMGGAGFDPAKVDVPGMVVKSEVSTPAGKMTITLIKAKEEAVDDKEFVKPEGYQEMQMPKLPGTDAPPANAVPKPSGEPK